MVAPASLQMAKDLDIVNSFEITMTISVFVLAYGKSGILVLNEWRS